MTKKDEDKGLWKEGESMKYIVKSAYKILRKSLSVECRDVYDFFIFFLKIKALPFVQIIEWRVLHNRVATR